MKCRSAITVLGQQYLYRSWKKCFKAEILSLISLCLIVSTSQVKSQDVSQIGKTNPITLSGNLRVSSSLYQATGDRDLLNPFNYSIGGNVNISAYNISVPISFYHTDGSSELSKSFNIAGASPYYKWIKLHLGDRSMRFSPYVMSRRNFFGVGLELTPGKWNISYMRGKLQNLYARQDTLSNTTIILPEFDRRINGGKLAYNGDVFGIGFDFVKVKDDISTLPDNYESITPIKAQENLAAATTVSLKLFKKLKLKANVASSILTQDLDFPIGIDSTEIPRAISRIIQPNLSTRVSFAGDASLSYSIKNIGIGATFKRIDPYYRSLAASYFQNDIINYTGNVNFTVAKKKVQIKTRVGVQEDNVSNTRAYVNRRVIGSIAATYIASKSFYTSVQYSNFQRENMSGLVELNDTLRYVSYSGNLLANIRYNREGDNIDYTYQLSGFSQTIRDESPLFAIDQEIINHSANGSVRLKLKGSNLGISPGINYGIFQFPDFTQRRYGSQVRVSKPWFDGALSTAFTTRFDFNDIDEFRDGYTWKTRLTANYKLKEKQRFTLSASYLDRQVITQNSFKEYRVIASYMYKFL